MWWSYLFVCILLFSTAPTYAATPFQFYGTTRYGKRTGIARREPRSGIFWTGSRYNRRDSDEIVGMKSTRRGNDFFLLGSRYGKRTGRAETKGRFDLDFCKFNRNLYPCNSSR